MSSAPRAPYPVRDGLRGSTRPARARAMDPWRLACACVAGLCGALLASCASVDVRGPVDDPQAAWRAHRAVLETRRSWRASGRIGFRSREDGWSAGFRWTQRDGPFEILLSGALGTKRVTIRGDGNAVSLRTSDGREMRAADAASLVSDELGVAVPVRALRNWLVGLPGAGSAFTHELDEAGRLRVLRQQGWEVLYSAYQPVGEVYLPGRVVASRPPHEIKVIVRQWSFLPAGQATAEARVQRPPEYAASQGSRS